MNYCDKCKVTVAANRIHCPLCQRRLSHVDGPSSAEPFPVIPTYYQKFELFFKVLTFVSIVAGLSAVLIDFLVPGNIWWSLIVVAGIVYMWLTVVTAVKKWQNICKNILYQVVFTSLIVTALDILTGWNKWSVDFVVPALCAFAMLAIAIIARIMSFQIQDYLVYLLVNTVFCLVPLVLMLTHVVNTAWPSLAAFVVCLVILSFILIFGGVNLMSELKRRLHL